MRTVRSLSELRAELAQARRRRRSIGLVPTMGAFHDGHLSLIRRARAETDVVVVWLFVNPAQFNNAEDLDAYPRGEARDAELAAAEGADFLFAPAARDVYPPGFATTVSVAGLTDRLEGAHRGRAHFDGVTTVVTKMLNMVAPDVAYFGQKDAQQAIVVRRLVSDLDMPVRIEVSPTIRDPDGLALSSRNALLGAADRERATALHRALERIREAVQAGRHDPAGLRQSAVAELREAGIEPDYVELVDPDTLEPVDRISGDVLALVAAWVGPVRLIDNELIHARPSEIGAAINNTPEIDDEVATPPGAPTTA